MSVLEWILLFSHFPDPLRKWRKGRVSHSALIRAGKEEAGIHFQDSGFFITLGARLLLP
jgi:hypothetical protein